MSNSDFTAGASRVGSRSDDSDYAHLFRLSQDLLCVAGLDGYFRKVNPAWTQALGWSEAELLARPVADFMHPDDRERTLAARARLAQGIALHGFENRYLCKNGSYRWLSWQSSVDVGAGKVFAVARDITERRRHDREQLVLSKLESTGILAGGIAHDFNNLLGGLLLNLDMVGLLGPITARQKLSLDRAIQAVHAAEALTRRLQMFAEGGLPVRRVLDLEPLLRNSVELVLAGCSVGRDCTIDPALEPILGDEAQVREVVRGLLLNAREAVEGGGTVAVEARNVTVAEQEVPGLPAGPYVRITINDSGRGISPENLPKVFGPYFTTKPRGPQKGVGLGLSICRTIVREHGGSLSLDSRERHGTTVTVHLPVAKPSEAGTSPAGEGGTVAASRVLVVTEDVRFGEVLARALRRIGYRVDSATRIPDAARLHREAHEAGDRFALVLLGEAWREGDSPGAILTTLRSCDPAVRAVLLAVDGDEAKPAPVVAGFAGVLNRSFSIETLGAVMAKALGRVEEWKR